MHTAVPSSIRLGWNLWDLDLWLLCHSTVVMNSHHIFYQLNYRNIIMTGRPVWQCLTLWPVNEFQPLRACISISRRGHIPWRPQRRSPNQSSHRRSRRCGPDWTRRSSGLGKRTGGSGWVRGYCGAAARLCPPRDHRSSTRCGSPWCQWTTTLQMLCSFPQGNQNVCYTTIVLRHEVMVAPTIMVSEWSKPLLWGMWMTYWVTILQPGLHLLSRFHPDIGCSTPWVTQTEKK